MDGVAGALRLEVSSYSDSYKIKNVYFVHIKIIDGILFESQKKLKI